MRVSPDFLGTSGVAQLEVFLPLYLRPKFHLSSTAMGMMFLPSTILYFILTPIVPMFAPRAGRAVVTGCGMLWFGYTLCFMTAPQPSRLWLQLFVVSGCGSGLALVEGCVTLMVGTITDRRHPRAGGYGFAYAATDMSFSLGYIAGPLISGALQQLLHLDFEWTFRAFGLACVAIAPTQLLLIPSTAVRVGSGAAAAAAPANGKDAESAPLLINQ